MRSYYTQNRNPVQVKLSTLCRQKISYLNASASEIVNDVFAAKGGISPVSYNSGRASRAQPQALYPWEH